MKMNGGAVTKLRCSQTALEIQTLGCGAYCRPGVIGFTDHGPMIGDLLFSRKCHFLS